MLSKTAETKPRPSAVSHEAAGSFSTGIRDAQVMSDSRKMLPLKDSGSSDQSGLRKGTQARIATHTAAPMKGKLSETAGNLRLTNTFAPIAAARIAATIPTRVQSTWMRLEVSLAIGE